MKQVKIKVQTKQIYNSHTDTHKEVFKGKISSKNGHIYIIYQEDKTTGLKITNQLKVSKDGSVSIRRMGEMQSVLHFTKDKPYTTFYNTGYGAMELEFIPIVIECSETATSYKIKLQYDIYMGNEKLSRNQYLLEATFLP